MALSSFKFVQWAPKDASMLQQSVGRKRILTSNSRLRSFKVIHFAISYRPTSGSMSPYNTAGLISEDSEEKLLSSSSTPLSFDDLKFVGLPVPEIIGGTPKNLDRTVPGYAHAPFSPKFLMGFCSDGPFEIILGKFEVHSSIGHP